MTTTPNLGLPELIASQAQKHVTHNEALRALDALVQLAVADRDLAAPPPAPGEGQRFIVAASASGDWAGHSGDIAAWQDNGWQFYAPQPGWLAYVVDEGALLAWTGTAWVDAISAITSLNNMTLLGVGTMADAANPFSARLNNVLWTAKTAAQGGSGDLRWTMSKEAAADTLSMLFQTNASGRAEIGLTGDDDLRVKVSPDGTSWIEALAIERASGAVRFRGTSSGNDAANGNVGEYISATRSIANAVSLITTTPANVASIALTSGDWDVVGQVTFDQSNVTGTKAIAALSRTAGVLPTPFDDTQGYIGIDTSFSSGPRNTLPVPTSRMSVSAATTVYLVARADFSAGTMKAAGWLSARRVR